MAGKNSNNEQHGGAVESPLLTKADVARRGNCCPRMVSYWMARGELPFIRLTPRMVRFLAADVEAFLQSRRVGGAK